MMGPMTPSDSPRRLDVDWCRRQFPGLGRQVDGRPAVFFDGPAGSQVPGRVIEAVRHYLTEMNANHGGLFETSRRSDEMLAEAHRAVADLVGADDPDTVVFGPNMTTLTFALSRALGKTWRPGDEVIVTRMDHDANVSPWVLAARDAGATVRHVSLRREDCTLDMDDLRAKLSARTRLVAITAASNAAGTVNPVREICRLAHAYGALVFVDAVHHAPHRRMDVQAWGCDFLACSAYKFFGPHVGVLWGRRALLESLPAYKVRPAPDQLPGKWMTGTQNHEGIAGALAAVEYLAELGRRHRPEASGRRQALVAAFDTITAYERALVGPLLAGLAQLEAIRVWGITEPHRLAERVPTVAVTHRRLRPARLAERLAARGIFVWHGHFYALPLTEALGLEPDGVVRIGLLHYNTADEVQRLLDELNSL